MASAQKRGNRWIGRYRGPDGKERTKTFDRQREAKAWAEAGEARVRQGTWTDPSRAKVYIEELANQYLATRQLKPKTVASYRSLLDSCILPRWGRVRLDQVSFSDVMEWVSDMRGSKGQTLSASRRRQAYHLLCAILDVAVHDDRVVRNPARPKGDSPSRSRFLPRPTVGKEHRYLTAQEVQRLADACQPWDTLIYVMAYGGLRWGEAAALRVDDVDELRGRLKVDETLVEINGHHSFGSPKSHAVRTVALPGFLRERLAPLLLGKAPRDLLFTSRNGQPLRNSNWRRTFDKAVQRAGLPRLTPHDLRHTAASLAISAGANVKVIQSMLGHQSAALTLDTYAGLFQTDLDEVAERLNAAHANALADSLRIPGPIASMPGGAQVPRQQA
jgi:integrase